MSKFSEWLFGKDVEPLADYRIIKKTHNNGKVSYLPQFLSWDRYVYFYDGENIREFSDLDDAEDFISQRIGNTVKSREVASEFTLNKDGNVVKVSL